MARKRTLSDIRDDLWNRKNDSFTAEMELIKKRIDTAAFIVYANEYVKRLNDLKVWCR